MAAVRTYTDQYIGGAWVASTNAGKFLDVTDSANGQVCCRVPDGSVQDMDRAVAAAKGAFLPWMNTPPAERKEIISKVLETWEGKKDECAAWLQKELGCTETFA